MQAPFWLQHWREGRIGFHRDAPMPLMIEHWPTLGIAAGTRVLVPLCGKSLDMLWLAAQGYRVLGVELSPVAVEQFVAENKLDAATYESAQGVHHVAGAIEIIQGDVFGLAEATLAGCHAIYDRAAIIALPPDIRARYARAVYDRLPAECRGLMITLEYPPGELEGPPFPVDRANIDELLADTWQIERLERRDILQSQPKFQSDGVTSLHTAVYGLTRQSAAAAP